MGGKEDAALVLRRKIFDFAGRLAVFAGALLAYILGVDIGGLVLDTGFSGGSVVVLLLWLLFLLWMIFQLLPGRMAGMAGDKIFGRSYRPPAHGYSPVALKEEKKRMDLGALWVLLVWGGIFAVLALLYFFTGIVGPGEVVLVVLAYYVGDAFCMLFWCPMQTVLMKNRCCVNCRIYGWACFLVCGPLLLLPGVLTYSLVAFSLVIFIRWEVVSHRHPERLWEGSNTVLSCAGCAEKTCTIKRTINENLKPRQRVRGGTK